MHYFFGFLLFFSASVVVAECYNIDRGFFSSYKAAEQACEGDAGGGFDCTTGLDNNSGFNYHAYARIEERSGEVLEPVSAAGSCGSSSRTETRYFYYYKWDISE